MISKATIPSQSVSQSVSQDSYTFFVPNNNKWA